MILLDRSDVKRNMYGRAQKGDFALYYHFLNPISIPDKFTAEIKIWNRV